MDDLLVPQKHIAENLWGWETGRHPLVVLRHGYQTRKSRLHVRSDFINYTECSWEGSLFLVLYSWQINTDWHIPMVRHQSTAGAEQIPETRYHPDPPIHITASACLDPLFIFFSPCPVCLAVVARVSLLGLSQVCWASSSCVESWGIQRVSTKVLDRSGDSSI